MSCVFPLLACWSVSAGSLPDSLLPARRQQTFSLPGADSLAAFSDLLGETDAADESSEAVSQPSAPFPLPGFIPEEIEGEVTLSCEIDFGALRGDYAVLTFDHMTGRGCIMLGGEQIAAFDSTAASYRSVNEAFDLSPLSCMLAVDLTDALRRGRKETLAIRFDGTRPSGISEPVLLRTAQKGYLSRLRITPDANSQTMTVRTQITALCAGRFLLRAQPFAPDGTADAVRETFFDCEAGASFEANMALSVPGSRFSAGKPFEAGSMKVSLLYQAKERSKPTLCDSAVLLCGYGAKAAFPYALPLTAGECMLPPEEIVSRISALHIPCVRLGIPAPDALLRALTRASVAARMPDNLPLRARLERLPCASFAAERVGEYASVSLEASAWQMGSMIQMPRNADPSLSDEDMLHEIAGRGIDPKDDRVHDVLIWLRAVAVRMRAEAARQGRFAGALCAPGEWTASDVAESLRTAFAPLHVSVVPLLGAWWTGSRLSASVHAFIPDGRFTADDPLIVHAVLEDENGQELARLRAPCRSSGGYTGILEAPLPDHPCVLQLTSRLTLHDEILEESTIPVYVGERGPLEAAFL